ncbi:MAG: hypothetical protein JSR39_00340 [Verrucomicrobia bacterium]|nr:hypothetical protein [Verrucomicrobiota bacterium]
MKNRSSLLFRRSWSFKVYILTLFLLLILISFCSVGAFAFSKQYASALSFSKGIAKRAVAAINEKLNAMAQSSVQITQVAANYVLELGDLSIEDPKLTLFMRNVIKNNQNFANFYMGFDNGNFIGSYNHSYTDTNTFFSKPSEPLPEGTVFSLTYIDMIANPPMETRRYLDKDFHELAREVFKPGPFGVKDRPWYVGAVEKGGVFWTGIYPFLYMKETGISVSNPMKDRNGTFKGVVAIDLPFVFLSHFIEEQIVGKTGKAFLINDQGKILAPMTLPGDEKKREELISIIADVYKAYVSKDQDEERFIVSYDHKKYLTYISKLPLAFHENWRIVTVAPLNDFLGATLLMQKQLLIITLGILLLTSFIIVKYAGRISSPIAILSKEVDKIGRLDLKSDRQIRSNIKEILLIENAVAALRRAVYSFAKYIPKEIVLDLFEKKEEIVLGGEKRELTMFFSRISEFSDIAESLSIDVLSQLLTEYLDKMSKIILSSNGTIDKFLGNGIMAFWGAPLPVSDHAAKACTTALLCKVMIARLNQKHKEAGMPEFVTLFGINTGTAIVGNIGTQERMNYTAIGDAVNITSRLEHIDKLYHTSILISENVHKQLNDQFVMRPLDEIAVKGKAQKVKIYELVGKFGEDKEIEPKEEQVLLCNLFREAYEAEEGNDIRKAYDLFKSIASKFPEDYPTQLHLKRIEDRLS